MCIAELNVSLLPCRHRWYHLSRPCSPATNLANCTGKLGLAGWEIKCDFCPYCAAWNLSETEYRLVGNDRAPAVGGLARTPSLTLSTTRRESRRGSLTRNDSSNSIMQMAQEKNRAMNARVDAYYSRISPESSLVPSPYAAQLRDVDEADSANLASSPSDTSSEAPESVHHSSTPSDKVGMFKKMRKKSKRISLGVFK